MPDRESAGRFDAVRVTNPPIEYQVMRLDRIYMPSITVFVR